MDNPLLKGAKPPFEMTAEKAWEWARFAEQNGNREKAAAWAKFARELKGA